MLKSPLTPSASINNDSALATSEMWIKSWISSGDLINGVYPRFKASKIVGRRDVFLCPDP
jgi:hypothetical protein